MGSNGFDNMEQGYWFSRSTRHLVSCGWTEGVTRGRSWSGTEPLQFVSHFFNECFEVPIWRQRLKDQQLCTAEHLGKLSARLMTIINQAVAE